LRLSFEPDEKTLICAEYSQNRENVSEYWYNEFLADLMRPWKIHQSSLKRAVTFFCIASLVNIEATLAFQFRQTTFDCLELEVMHDGLECYWSEFLIAKVDPLG
jgi:hypothetical protein